MSDDLTANEDLKPSKVLPLMLLEPSEDRLYTINEDSSSDGSSPVKRPLKQQETFYQQVAASILDSITSNQL